MPTTSPSMRIFSFFLLLVLLFVGPVQVLSGPLGDRVTELERKQTNADTLQKVTEKQNEELRDRMEYQITFFSIIAGLASALILIGVLFGFSRFKDIEANTEQALKKFSGDLQEELKENADSDLKDIKTTLEKEKTALSDKLIEDFRGLKKELDEVKGENEKNKTMLRETTQGLEAAKQSHQSNPLLDDYWKRKVESEMTEQNWLDYANESETDKAIEVLQKGLTIFPNSLFLHYRLGERALGQNKLFVPLQAFMTTEKINKNYAFSLYYLSMLFGRAREFSKSLQIAQKAHQYNSQNSWFLFRLTWCNLNISDWQTSNSLLKLSTKMYQDDVIFLDLFALYYLNPLQKNFHKAEEYAKKAVALRAGISGYLTLILVYLLWEEKRSLAQIELIKKQPEQLLDADKLPYNIYANLILFLDGASIENCKVNSNDTFSQFSKTYYQYSITPLTNWANDPDNGLTAEQTEGVKALIQIPLDHNQRLRDEDIARTDAEFGEGTWEKAFADAALLLDDDLEGKEEPSWEGMPED